MSGEQHEIPEHGTAKAYYPYRKKKEKPEEPELTA